MPNKLVAILFHYFTLLATTYVSKNPLSASTRLNLTFDLFLITFFSKHNIYLVVYNFYEYF